MCVYIYVWSPSVATGGNLHYLFDDVLILVTIYILPDISYRFKNIQQQQKITERVWDMHFTPLLHIFSESHFYKRVWYLYIRLIPGKRIQRTGIKIKSFFQEPCVFYGSCLSWKSDEGSSTERGHLMRLLSSEMRSSALKLSLEYLKVKCHTRGYSEGRFILPPKRPAFWMIEQIFNG